MFMKKILVLIAIISYISTACKKEINYIKPEQGGIDIVSNIYFNASKNLEDNDNIIISKINYKNDTIIELVPNKELPSLMDKIFVIKDTLAYDVTELEQPLFTSLKYLNPIPIAEKKIGANFHMDYLPNYEWRHELPDTVLFKKNYKRFYVNTPEVYNTFYIYPTDTLLPFSFFKSDTYIQEKYGGRIERIEIYEKKKDLFISVQLFPRKQWDKEAKDIFEFNEFVKNRK